MDYTAKELEEALVNWYYEDDEDRDGELFMNFYYEELTSGDLPTLEGFGKVDFVESSGGEGDGAPIEVIIKVSMPGTRGVTRYFRKTGYYSSWGESEMDGELEEVFPRQVTRTEYYSKEEQ